MKRREFIAGLGMAAWPLVVRAQQRSVPVIGSRALPSGSDARYDAPGRSARTLIGTPCPEPRPVIDRRQLERIQPVYRGFLYPAPPRSGVPVARRSSGGDAGGRRLQNLSRETRTGLWRESNQSLSAPRIPAGKKFGEGRD
jgi:hypothetical protein